jgi:ABC-type multidrug transport system fused ATPase/permease subunit
VSRSPACTCRSLLTPRSCRFTSPFALALCLGLLIWQIGVSALAGFAILVVAIPAQGWVMKSLFMTRRESMKFTDKRAKLINELLSSIQIVKSFAFERKFLEKIGAIRRKELQGIRKLIIVRSAMIALAFSLPTLASVVGFLVYAALGNSLLEGGANTTSRVFIALTLFQLLRMPLMFLPLSFSSAADAYAAISRLSNVFTAELLEDKSERAPEAKFSLELIDACFKYDEVDPSKDDEKKKKHKKGHAKDTHAAKPVVAAEQGNAKPPSFMQRLFKPKQSIAVAPSSETGLPKPVTANKAAETELTDAPEEFDEKHEPAEEVPFSLRNINLRFTPGELVAIVGPVGSGKTSIFSGLTGEMRMESGRIIWGGNGLAAYSAQQPWIQAASVRDNITFGLAFEEERYWEVVKTCELEADLRMLPQGDMTEIGEKGTTLSGGQKARVNLARALYFDAEIYMLDDPLSAVDPHVGKALFQNLILGLRARGKTVLLVTHAIHVLPQCDRIITLVDGHVAEDGRYETLVHAGGPFQKLVQDFGGDAQEEEEEHKEDEEEAIDEAAAALRHDKKTIARAAMTDADGTKAMQTQEERNTGSIALSVYKAYFHAGRGWIMVPLVLTGLVLMQGAVVMGSYTLRWWLSDDLAWTQGQYMGLYAGLGVATAFFTGLMGISTGMFSYYAAAEIHRQSITRVLYAPLSFFNVTPKGRIANRFSKDADSLDNQLADSFRMAASTIAQVIGACILISILAHYFAPAVAGILVFYFIGAAIYRRSAREVKRIDGTLRGSLYAHISETLHGVSTVKAYGETQRFLRDHFRLMDYENRAYFMTITNQRWLGIRLDFLGALLVFIVALLTTAGASQGISPASTGLALSYILQVSQSFSWMTRQIAEVENEMSSVERLNHYATEIDEEAPQEIPDAHLPAEWPQAGAIAIRDVQLRYRPELPIVLKGISLDVKAGQKVGIVGRTGSGKSTLLTALLRLVELEAGSIVIDGVDVSKIGLRDLRQRIAILPQDPTLFSGTLRSNLDPFGQYDDARLWDALRRAHLVDSDSAGGTPAHGGTPAPSGRATPTGIEPDAADESKVSRFTLDTTIEEEGNNLSLGQRSLVSLARALVKDSRVILLDEATASVDVETDAKIQTTLNEAFGDRTLLCIAHRLRTILNYDLVCVVDSGRVAEYASPLELFDQGGIFHE